MKSTTLVFLALAAGAAAQGPEDAADIHAIFDALGSNNDPSMSMVSSLDGFTPSEVDGTIGFSSFVNAAPSMADVPFPVQGAANGPKVEAFINIFDLNKDGIISGDDFGGLPGVNPNQADNNAVVPFESSSFNADFGLALHDTTGMFGPKADLGFGQDVTAVPPVPGNSVPMPPTIPQVPSVNGDFFTLPSAVPGAKDSPWAPSAPGSALPQALSMPAFLQFPESFIEVSSETHHVAADTQDQKGPSLLQLSSVRLRGVRSP